MTDHPGDDGTADGPDEALSVPRNGRARAIRFSTLARLCRALDCQPGDLLSYHADQPAGRPSG